MSGDPIVYRGSSRRVSTPDGTYVFPRGEAVEVPEPLRSRLLAQGTFEAVETKGTGRSRRAPARSGSDSDRSRAETALKARESDQANADSDD